MKTPHKHAEILRAIADCVQLQRKGYGDEWIDCTAEVALVRLSMDMPTRIKPEPKPDVVLYSNAYPHQMHQTESMSRDFAGGGSKGVIKYIFDGETGALKSAEVLK